MGRPFQRPLGEMLSSSTVNVLWGFLNLALGYLLVCRVGAFNACSTADAVSPGAAALVVALVSARHFGCFLGGRELARS